MPDIASNIELLKSRLPSNVKVVAVSKTRPASDILSIYNTGHRIFGENRVQELLRKKDLLPPDIEWHLVGHLQSNKIKHIVEFIDTIESVDSFRLLKLINDQASLIDRVVKCLLQIHIAREEVKFGFTMDELQEMLETEDFRQMHNVQLCGVMGMATFTDDRNQIRNEFSYLAHCFHELKNTYFIDDNYFKEISMGMSGDFEIALEEGCTIVRIGSLIFGERAKTN
jgi:pyridoxal phosphate enzyme (YggS family)